MPLVSLRDSVVFPFTTVFLYLPERFTQYYVLTLNSQAVINTYLIIGCDPHLIIKNVAYIFKLNSNKIVGPQISVIEILKALEDFGIDMIRGTVNEIYNSVDIPEDLSRSIFLELPKNRHGANEYKFHRTTSLISLISKFII